MRCLVLQYRSSVKSSRLVGVKTFTVINQEKCDGRKATGEGTENLQQELASVLPISCLGLNSLSII